MQVLCTHTRNVTNQACKSKPDKITKKILNISGYPVLFHRWTTVFENYPKENI